MHKYGLVTFITDLPKNYEFSKDDWPLHITQVDTFEVKLSAQELKLKMLDVIQHKESIKTKAIGDDYFGPNLDIPVTRLDLVPELFNLHIEIVKMLENNGAIFKRPFILKKAFKPHVTIIGSERINVGEVIEISSLSIIDKEPRGNVNMRLIAENINLK